MNSGGCRDQTQYSARSDRRACRRPRINSGLHRCGESRECGRNRPCHAAVRDADADPLGHADSYAVRHHDPDSDPYGDTDADSDGHAYGPALTPDGRTMFFSAGSDNPFAPGAINHICVSQRKNIHEPWGAPIYLDTINCATCFGGLPTIRGNGKEICWIGDRGDSYGDKDIYCAQRR